MNIEEIDGRIQDELDCAEGIVANDFVDTMNRIIIPEFDWSD